MTIVFASLLLLMGISTSQANWYGKKEQGWFWYKKERSLDRTRSRKKMSSPQNKRPKTYTQRLSDLQKEVKEYQARAVLEPSLENIHQFQQLQERLINQASRFENIWRMAALLSPKGYRPSDQPSSRHREIFEQQKKNQLDQTLKTLSRTHGLFFVYKQGCPYCHQFAPLVCQFAKTYGFEIKAISADGGEIDEFPEAVLDNGTLSIINPKGIYPALFLVNPQRQRVTPVAWGMVSLSQLLDNMALFLDAKEKNLVE